MKRETLKSSSSASQSVSRAAGLQTNALPRCQHRGESGRNCRALAAAASDPDAASGSGANLCARHAAAGEKKRRTDDVAALLGAVTSRRYLGK